jgi:hypothetical protein
MMLVSTGMRFRLSLSQMVAVAAMVASGPREGLDVTRRIHANNEAARP